MDKLFTAPDAWTGGFYELAMELGPRDDARLVDALRAVWSHPSIERCYLESGREPPEQARVSVDAAMRACGQVYVGNGTGDEGSDTAAPLVQSGHVYGLAHLHGGYVVPCATLTVREEGGSDWVVFYIPVGSARLSTPALRSSLPWSGSRLQASTTQPNSRRRFQISGPPGFYCRGWGGSRTSRGRPLE